METARSNEALTPPRRSSHPSVLDPLLRDEAQPDLGETCEARLSAVVEVGLSERVDETFNERLEACLRRALEAIDSASTERTSSVEAPATTTNAMETPSTQTPATTTNLMETSATTPSLDAFLTVPRPPRRKVPQGLLVGGAVVAAGALALNFANALSRSAMLAVLICFAAVVGLISDVRA